MKKVLFKLYEFQFSGIESYLLSLSARIKTLILFSKVILQKHFSSILSLMQLPN